MPFTDGNVTGQWVVRLGKLTRGGEAAGDPSPWWWTSTAPGRKEKREEIVLEPNAESSVQELFLWTQLLLKISCLSQERATGQISILFFLPSSVMSVTLVDRTQRKAGSKGGCSLQTLPSQGQRAEGRAGTGGKSTWKTHTKDGDHALSV